MRTPASPGLSPALFGTLLLSTCLPIPAPADPATITSLAARGALVYAGTEGGGLLVSTDGGLRFEKDAGVDCPRGIVRDVRLFGPPHQRSAAVACGFVTTAFFLVDGRWWRDQQWFDPGLGPERDVGPGSPLVADDPLNDSRPTRVSVWRSCDPLSCDDYATVNTNTRVVSKDWNPSVTRLLAPISTRSPFLVLAELTASSATFYRGLARQQLVPKGSFLGYYDLNGGPNLEPLSTIDDGGLLFVGRDGGRSERLIAVGEKGIWLSDDEGRSFRLRRPWDSLRASAVDPTAFGRYAVARGERAFATSDGGETWAQVLEADVPIMALAFDDEDPTRLLAGLADGSVRWARLLSGLDEPAGRPTLLAPNHTAPNGLRLDWVSRARSVSRQRIDRRVDGVWETVAALDDQARSFTDTAPPADVDLEYRVVSIGDTGLEAASDEVSAVAPTTAPLPPGNLRAESLGDEGYRLTWEDRSGREEGYLVEFLGGQFVFRPLVLLPAGSTSYEVSSRLVRHAQGFFRVRAVNARGQSEPTLVESAGGRPPHGPPHINGALGEDGVPSLTISSDLDAVDADLERSLDDAPFETIVRLRLDAGTSGTRTASYVDVGVEPDHNVVYRARGVNPAGVGPASVELSLGTWTTVPRAPEGLSVTVESSTTNSLRRLVGSWLDRSGREDGFQLFARAAYGDRDELLGTTARNTGALTVPYAPTPPWASSPRVAGDLVISARAFNSAGMSEPAEGRVRVWPTLPGSFPQLLPSVLVEAGSGAWETELVLSGSVSYGLQYRLLESTGDVLLAGWLLSSPYLHALPPRANLWDEIRRGNALLPRDGLMSGALFLESYGRGRAPCVRVTRAVAQGDRIGHAGFAATAVRPGSLGTHPLVVVGLVQNARFASDLVLVHAGLEEGDIQLAVRVVDGATGTRRTLEGITLSRGERRRIPDVLAAAGLSPPCEGYTVIELLGGNAAFFAHALVRDLDSLDARYVPPGWLDEDPERTTLIVPRVEESERFVSRAVIANTTGADISILAEYVESVPSYRVLPALVIDLPAGRQNVVDILGELRARGDLPAEAAGEERLGTLRLRRVDGGAVDGVGAHAELVTRDGRFGAVVGSTFQGFGTEGWNFFTGRLERSSIEAASGEGAEAVAVNVSDQPIHVFARLNVSGRPKIAEADLPPGALLRLQRPPTQAGPDLERLDFIRDSYAGVVYAYSLEVDPVTGDPSVFVASGPD